MKIGVFAYNFPHLKTQMGLHNLCIEGYKPEIVFAADPVELKFYQSKIRTGPKDLFLTHPKKLCDFYGIEYHVVKHNSQKVKNLININELDVGIILGARILKPVAFEDFKIGVINMHPGILPENRGLDTIKWAIEDNLPQGATAHLINAEIDKGKLLKRKDIKVYPDDSLLDIQLRIQNLEQKLMLDSLKILQEKKLSELKSLGQGKYNKSMPPEIELDLLVKFKGYKKNFFRP